MHPSCPNEKQMFDTTFSLLQQMCLSAYNVSFPSR